MSVDDAEDTTVDVSPDDQPADGSVEAEEPAADAEPGDAAPAEAETEPMGQDPSPGDTRRSERDDRRDVAAADAEAAARTAVGDAETVQLTVYRYDPDVADKQEPHFDEFHVPKEPGMTVLDALIYARDHYDSTLTFRHSCRQGVCGSDAMFVNGRQRLCCKTQIADLEEPVQIEPLPHQDVEKDLVVDMEHFYDQMDAVEPYFQSEELPEDELEEQRQSPENREEIKLATRCIWCGACASSCNIAAGDNQYLGPAAINKAYRFAMDERESDKQDHRIDVLAQEHGVWRCQTQFSCTEVCPKDIPLTEHIQEIKRESIKRSLKFW
jgi:succinate dehydrogenase / fumarate reductase iron-sulfur subunit